MNIEIKGKADPKGEQDFWCKKILTGGRKCGEPFPDHFNGSINDHEFSPLAKSTIKKLKAIKKFNLKEKKIKNDMSGICEYCGLEIDETEIYNECPNANSRRKKN